MTVEFQGDIRFRDYADALHSGNLDVCTSMRDKFADDDEIMAKFHRLELLWIQEMSLYVREIQILRHERDGWKKQAEGKIKTARKYLKQAEKARVCHDEPFVVNGFRKGKA